MPVGGGGDWVSMQLNNNTEMMLYLIRDARGQIASTYIGYIDPRAESFLLPANALKVTVLDHWRSPGTRANYPPGWRLEINNPKLQASVMLIPQLKDQELVAD